MKDKTFPGFIVAAWNEYQELNSERSIWVDYTAQVLEVLFDESQLGYAYEFRAATTPFDRESGSVMAFAGDQRSAIQAGITYLRSLHKRLPLMVDEASKSSRRKKIVKDERIPDDPQVQTTIRLLEKVNPELANAYRQVRRDLQDVTRLSYRGTANELREILREVLFRLAPDNEVAARPWFIAASENGKPTQQQRAKYILEKKETGSEVRTVAEQSLLVVEDGLSKLVRGIYSRTSVASHTGQDLEEIRKQVRYFDPLIHDLCD